MKKNSLLVLAFALFCVSTTFAQTKMRTIVWPPIDDPMGNVIADVNGRLVSTEIKALAIVSISADGKPITVEDPFTAQDDWLKSLAITVRNISDRPIKAIRIGFGLPEATVTGAGTGFSLEYGKELSTGIDYGEQKSIAPGEEVEIFRNDRHYKRDSEGIAKRTGLLNFTQLMIGVTTVKFDDGTVWSSRKLPITK